MKALIAALFVLVTNQAFAGIPTEIPAQIVFTGNCVRVGDYSSYTFDLNIFVTTSDSNRIVATYTFDSEADCESAVKKLDLIINRAAAADQTVEVSDTTISATGKPAPAEKCK
jgi:hypothetical protein